MKPNAQVRDLSNANRFPTDTSTSSNRIPDTLSSSSTNNTNISYGDSIDPSSSYFATQPLPASLGRTSDDFGHSNAWDRARANFKMNLNLQDKEIARWRKWYSKNRNYMSIVFGRAQPYLYYILNEIEKRNLPAELVLLPVIESAYNPYAYSKSDASGLWQFIPNTGKLHDLKQTWWYDGRRDVYSSTKAALDYLDYLQKTFEGDWLLALASYNGGVGLVSRAVKANKRNNKTSDFWALKLPQETREYVPKFIALAQMLQNPDYFQLEIPLIENKPAFVVVHTKAQIELLQAAELAEISLDLLKRYNPGFKRWVSDPAGPHRLLIPVEKAETFQAALNTLPEAKRGKWKYYKVKQGDTLTKLATKHNIDLQHLKRANHLKTNRISKGMPLLIPVSGTIQKPNQRNSSFLESEKKVARKTTGSIKNASYKVKAGDTLSQIAQRHNIRLATLAKLNQIQSDATLKTGHILLIPNPATRQNSKHQIAHIVMEGESLFSIASRYNIKVKDIQHSNDLSGSQLIFPGQELVLELDSK